MSGIYIHGMEMPTDGFITITVTSDGRVLGNSKKERGKFEYLGNEDIAKAVPVPDHGRLIDADKLLNAELPKNMALQGDTRIPYQPTAWQIADMITHAPTIIPADERLYDSLKRGLEQAVNGACRSETIPADKEADE